MAMNMHNFSVIVLRCCLLPTSAQARCHHGWLEMPAGPAAIAAVPPYPPPPHSWSPQFSARYTTYNAVQWKQCTENQDFAQHYSPPPSCMYVAVHPRPPHAAMALQGMPAALHTLHIRLLYNL